MSLMIQVWVHTKSLLHVQVLVAHHGLVVMGLLRQQTPPLGEHLAKDPIPSLQHLVKTQ